VSDPTVPPQPQPQPPRRCHGLIESFRFAFEGVGYLFRTQRNSRFHLAAAAVVCVLAAWLRVTRVECAVLIVVSASVIVLEGLNTALEAVVDLASPEIHPLAKTAKDVSAGMVLVAAIAAAIVGLLILGPRLLALL
jgi:diacylglycerol kinase